MYNKLFVVVKHYTNLAGMTRTEIHPKVFKTREAANAEREAIFAEEHNEPGIQIVPVEVVESEHPIIYWRNYTYEIGHGKATGCEYYKDKEGTTLLGRNPYRARRKDGDVRINGFVYTAIKMDARA